MTTKLDEVANNLSSLRQELVSINPTTGEELGRIIAADHAEVEQVMSSAHQAFQSWSKTPIRERQKYLRRLNDCIFEQTDEIATLIAREQGKPVIEAKVAEILSVLAINRNLYRKAQHILQDEKAKHELILFTHKRSYYRYVPYGVVLIISPWNYPFSVPVPEITAAIVAGNTVVFKPAPHSVLIGQKIHELFHQAGFPEGVVNTIFVSDDDAPYLVEQPVVKKIIFTGSTATGAKVMGTAASQLTPVLLELGGKDPAIVVADADIARAAKGIVWGAMFTSGQVCASVERVYVERSVAAKFISACVDEVAKLRVGDPLDEDIDLGPLTTAHQLEIVMDHVADAVAKGAKVVVGGHRIGNQGYFFQPTILTGVNHSMKIMTEETFGPILPIMTVNSLDEAIRLANDSSFGLSAFGWTSNKAIAIKLQRELQAGTVMINDSTCTWGEPNAPWGGMKKSGIGRTRARFGLMEMVQVKFISSDRGNNTYNPWWFPYDRSSREFGEQAIRLLFAKRLLSKILPLVRLLKNSRFVATAHWPNILSNLAKLF